MSVNAGHRRRVSASAFLVAVLGTVTFCCNDAAMKLSILKIGTFTTLFWRNLIGIGLSGSIYLLRKPHWPRRAVMRVHLLRGLLSMLMSVTFFWGLARIPMAQAVAMTFIAPLISLYLSARHLGEKVTLSTLLASLLGFCGVLVIVRDQWQSSTGSDATWGTLAVVFSALLYSVNIILMRMQALVSGPIEVAFWQSVVIAACVGIVAPWWVDRLPASSAPLIIAAASMWILSLLLFAWAYARGEASFLSTSEYTGFLWASALGWWVFHERVSVATLIGALLIIGGCLIAARLGAPRPLESGPA